MSKLYRKALSTEEETREDARLSFARGRRNKPPVRHKGKPVREKYSIEDRLLRESIVHWT